MWECLTMKFQFHKVQLKVSSNSFLNAFASFQFHKVQLKVNSVSVIYSLTSFQFHKVQLKDETSISDIITVGSFNSIRYN